MSSDWFNIRFGAYHLHIGPGRWFPRVRWGWNDYWADPARRAEPTYRWFEIMEAPWQ